MKPSLIFSAIAAIMVQQFAMYYFMQTFGLGLFASAGLGILVALAVYFILYFIQNRFAGRGKSE